MCWRCVGGVLAVFSGGFRGMGAPFVCRCGDFGWGAGCFRSVFGGFFGFFGGFHGRFWVFRGDFVGLAHHFVPVLWRVGVGYRKLVFGWSVFGEGVCIWVSGPGLGC